ncbi:hypothetical protein Anapl_04636 [Anas platyrhynchos]|uniref:Uncharacterized protein n=1 Tax=Anas platyrhynchos TaxID=8839 RepID=R0K237_ANAPL|nr:hypothetical protein Anapl_04636 [Anas platyrhynchos]
MVCMGKKGALSLDQMEKKRERCTHAYARKEDAKKEHEETPVASCTNYRLVFRDAVELKEECEEASQEAVWLGTGEHKEGPKKPSTKHPNSKEETSAPRGGTVRLLTLRPGGKNRVLLVLRAAHKGLKLARALKLRFKTGEYLRRVPPAARTRALNALAQKFPRGAAEHKCQYLEVSAK